MQNTITATLTAARAAETALMGAIQQAASALDTIARDPVTEALAQLSRSAKDAKARLDAARVEASTILLEAIAGFEGFSFEVVEVDSQPAPTVEPTPEPLPAPSFVALEIRPIPEATVEECEGCFDLTADVITRGDGVRRCPSCERSREDALAVESRVAEAAPRCVMAVDSDESLAYPCGVAGCPVPDHAQQEVTTAANEGTAEPSPEAPKKPRGGKRKGK